MLDLALAAALALAFLVLLGATGRLHFLVDEMPSAPRRGIALTLLWLVLACCIFYPSVSPGEAADVDPETLTFVSIFVGQIILGTFCAVWWLLGRPVPLARFLRLEHGSIDDVRYGLAVGAVAWMLAIAASAAVAMTMLAIGYEPGAGTDSIAAPVDIPPILHWLVDLPVWRKLIVVAIAMTVEEAFFRAYLQTRIGWLLSSALFALSHGGYGLPTLTAAVFVVSLAIGWALRTRDTLLPCIVAHGIFDAVQLLVVMPLAIDRLRELS